MIQARTLSTTLLAALLLAAPAAHAAGELTLTPNGELTDTLRQVVHPELRGQGPQAPAPAATAPLPAPAPVADSAAGTAADGHYVYQARIGRDPFLPPVEVRGSQMQSLASLPALERYPLGDFSLIGIVWNNSNKAAMVSTPDGKGFTVRVGTRIGNSDGKVRRITQDSVVIEEFRTDVFGARKKFETVLALRPEEVIP